MAENYVSGTDYQVIESTAAVRQNAKSDSALLTEALFGEVVTLYEENGGWGWGQLKSDEYVGYLPLHSLSPQINRPTHHVSVLRTYVYPAPDIKSPPLDLLSLNSQLCAAGAEGPFLQLKTGGFIISAHTSPKGEYAGDFVAIAENFAGTPYLWGGKTSLGLDCSGLVQLSLAACGKTVRRDSDMLQEQTGTEITITPELAGLQRGDLVFWSGHVGIMCDDRTIVHSNGFHMATVIEPLKLARDRISSLFGEITTIKRLADYPF